ncbi:MAG: TlpA family protein disulfide reductase [Planctomycetota bacterium]
MLLPLALLLGTSASAQQVVGRSFPNWEQAKRFPSKGPATAISPRHTESYCGDAVVLLAPRGGDSVAKDLAAMLAILPPDRHDAAQRRVVRIVVALPTDNKRPAVPDANTDALVATQRIEYVHVPGIDAGYAAPKRPWIAVHDSRGIVQDVLPQTAPPPGKPAPAQTPTKRIKAALDRSFRHWPRNPLIGQPMEDLAGLTLQDLPQPNPEESPAASSEQPLAAVQAPADGLVLYRFWTDGCPHCRASLPDLAELAQSHPLLRLIPVYHRKGTPRTTSWLRDYLADLGVRGPWAIDPKWRTLKKLMQRGNLKSATSVSFLVDGYGIIRWVHRGPRVHRDQGPIQWPARIDFLELEGIVQRWSKQ